MSERAPGRTGFIEMVRKANAPPPPEHSVTFRVATGVAVLTGILACASVGEISATTALVASVGTVTGMAFSYRTRSHPWQWVKLLLAFAVIGVFAAFVAEVVGAAHTGELSSIEVPLAGLFTWVQVIHSFDVPARRDLLFSLAAAGALLTVAAAQAMSPGFLVYVACWLVATLVGLACSWRSMTGSHGRVPLGAVAGGFLVVVVVGALLLTVLPAPRAAQSITLPSSLTSYLPLPDPTSITGGGSQSTEPAQAGKPGGRIGVGGYIGFAGALNTAVRGALGNQVVLRVRADRPGYFLGETYDQWTGQSWTQSKTDQATIPVTGGSPFDVSSAYDEIQADHHRVDDYGLANGGQQFSIAGAAPQSNVQTFYVEQPLANLLFATSQPAEVYFPAHTLIVGGDGSVRSTVAMTPGTVYTVVSDDSEQPPSVLAKIPDVAGYYSSQAFLQTYLQLPPGGYPRVHVLAAAIVAEAHATTPYEQVAALEAWMAKHVEYTTAIPPLAKGQDAVDSVPVRVEARLLRADLDGAGGHAAHARGAGARGDRLRARAVRPAERPVRDPGEGRPRLGAGVVPRLRLAELRPDGPGPARPGGPRRGAAARPRRRHRPPALGPDRDGRRPRGRWRAGGGEGPAPAAAADRMGRGAHRRAGAARGGGRPRPAADRDASRVRPAAGERGELAGRRGGDRGALDGGRHDPARRLRPPAAGRLGPRLRRVGRERAAPAPPPATAQPAVSASASSKPAPRSSRGR